MDSAVPLSGLRDDRKRALEELLGPTLAQIAPPPRRRPPRRTRRRATGKAKARRWERGDEEKDEGGEERDADEGGKGGKREPHEAGSALFSIELGVEFIGRWFDYSDPRTQNLPPYSVFGQPALSVSGEVYPLASTDIAVLKGLGVTAGYARALGLNSAVGDGDPISTTYQRINLGLRERLSIGEASVLGISAGLRFLTFEIDAPADLARTVPNVSYTLFRAGLDGRFPVGPIALALGADVHPAALVRPGLRAVHRGERAGHRRDGRGDGPRRDRHRGAPARRVRPVLLVVPARAGRRVHRRRGHRPVPGTAARRSLRLLREVARDVHDFPLRARRAHRGRPADRRRAPPELRWDPGRGRVPLDDQGRAAPTTRGRPAAPPR